MNSNNRFGSETVDDDEFLRHPRSGSGYMLSNQYNQLGHNQGRPQPPPQPSPAQSNNSLEQQRQALIQRRKEVEDRTLASSERGLGLLFESEKVGSATAVELTRQKEQLLNTESKLDEINSSLRQSERHLQGIRSVFGSVRNYFSGRSASAASTGNVPGNAPGVNRNAGPASGPGQSSYNDFNNRVSQSHHNISGSVQQQKQLQQGQQSYSSAVDDQVDRNLDDMASSLARLKGLAQGLNTELDEHNDIMDRVADKADTVGFKVDKQNKDMGKILKK